MTWLWAGSNLETVDPEALSMAAVEVYFCVCIKHLPNRLHWILVASLLLATAMVTVVCMAVLLALDFSWYQGA